ncbi:MAG: ECF transporter S component [Lachnospiraceae bacterium]|nr:ECF transporter S component [Lachnospiraceae bacterium]
MNKKKFNTKKMVQLAILIAIIMLMAFTPLGYLKIFVLDITLIVVPVAVGAVLLGPTAGAILGFTFGFTSFILSFSSPLGAMMLDISPVFRVLTCIIPRVLCGWLTGVVYSVMRKGNKVSKFAVPVANLSCPIFNTIFFMTALMLFYYNTPAIQDMATSMGVFNPIALVFAMVGVNAVIEAVACFVVGTAITKALQVAFKL